MEASPMVRTMATASRIAKHLGVTDIKINYMFSEWQSSGLFDENPMPFIEFKNKSSQQLDKEYNLQGIKFHDTKDFFEEINQVYPEDRDKLDNRTSLAAKSFKPAFDNQKKGT